ncbi:cytochrome c biogenesis protein ResB [Kroppenstedtia eburnea]|uniref:Cytochrome c biogenesis protein n=1 Tax=Kroppenstedtia eburnea TaxID=714067 RepID=A0A1N7INX9_9BACL|nr:cytochrome c biogenesis protein ResB [Kroppenstedtia eburnea]QKI82021.1 cytochrome c biogenesis protein ResB [Kroppenstedtia eburnea]SIS38762.1 cytochrome c biogenesis protein [Kroppenstedtia eburnea]
MINNTKCDCGHNNPVGTVLCEHCGKPLDEKGDSDRPLEMRYEGKARRSQTQKATLFDRIWNFFSSVKVAIWLILITLVVSILGTLLPQEQYIPSNRPEIYYSETYGFWGEVFYRLGLSNLYESPVYIALLASIGISLVVCSLDRVIPLYKALTHQKVVKNIRFINRQRVSRTETVPESDKETLLDRLAESLSQKHYRIRREGDSILAEKGRFSRWGPYINHIGLILFLVGILLRHTVPGWYLDKYVYVREGETKKLPELNYYVKNVKATAELYDPKEMPESDKSQPTVKKYETRLILYEKDHETGKLRELKRGTAIVNHSFKYDDLELFQSDFTTETQAIQLNVKDKQKNRNLDTFKVDLFDPAPKYQLKNGIHIDILDYFPDFVMEGNRPATKSETPNRPAFIFSVDAPDLKKPEVSWMISGTNLDDINRKNRYTMELKGLETANVSGLMIRVDKGLPIIFLGGIISMIGLVMGFFWNHRRVWIRWQDGHLHVGAHTNKNWFGLRRELEQATEKTDLPLSFSTDRRQEVD